MGILFDTAAAVRLTAVHLDALASDVEDHEGFLPERADTVSEIQTQVAALVRLATDLERRAAGIDLHPAEAHSTAALHFARLTGAGFGAKVKGNVMDSPNQALESAVYHLARQKADTFLVEITGTDTAGPSFALLLERRDDGQVIICE